MTEIFDKAINEYEQQHHTVTRFMNGVIDAFKLEPSLNKGPSPFIHTIKSRTKDPAHLRDKLSRMGDRFNPQESVFKAVNDLAGIRILHLYQDDFPEIHNHILKMINDGEWRLLEKPVAYSWDPELDEFFKALDLEVKIKESHYTSIHYVVAPPNPATSISCEIQVRTLFEEIWGEIDHSINYPYKTESISTREQLRVMSKLISTGSRLATSIYRTHKS